MLSRAFLYFAWGTVLFILSLASASLLDPSSTEQTAAARREAASAEMAYRGVCADPGVTFAEGAPRVPRQWGKVILPPYVGHGWGELAGWTLYMFLLVAGVARLLGDEVTRPLREMASQARALGMGQPPPPDPSRPRSGVFTELASEFDRMQNILQQRELELHERHQSLMQSASAKQRLVEGTYRALREPLLAMQADVLRLSLVGSAAESILGGLDTTLRLVEDLRDLSALDQGSLRVQRSPLNLAAVLVRARASLEPELRRKGLEFRWSVPALPAFEGDPQRLGQVFLNLLGNAVKFTQQGFVAVTAEVESNQIRVRIEDTGCGLGEWKADLSLPFSQAPRARSYGGSGLGLYLSARLVELHGGRLALLPTEQGTCAEVELPFRLPPSNPA